MLYFDRIEVYERIDVNKMSASKECDICHYWCFLNKGFKFQPNVCNRSPDLSMMPMKLSDVTILNFESADYCCIISGISKNEAISLIHNADLTKKTRNTIKHKNLSRIKTVKEILMFEDIKIEKNKFYQNKTPIF